MKVAVHGAVDLLPVGTTYLEGSFVSFVNFHTWSTILLNVMCF